MKYCPKCKQLLSLDNFNKDRTTKDGLQSICKHCGKSYESNPSYRFRRWALNTIKTHKKKFKICISLEKLIYKAEQSQYCKICGVKLNWERGNKGRRPHPDNPTWDRVNNDNFMSDDNTAIICHRCNTLKSDGTLKEMIKYCKSVIERNIYD